MKNSGKETIIKKYIDNEKPYELIKTIRHNKLCCYPLRLNTSITPRKINKNKLLEYSTLKVKSFMVLFMVLHGIDITLMLGFMVDFT